MVFRFCGKFIRILMIKIGRGRYGNLLIHFEYFRIEGLELHFEKYFDFSKEISLFDDKSLLWRFFLQNSARIKD